MRILLHPKIDAVVARTITGHDVRPTADEACATLDGVDLLRAAADRGFDAVIGIAAPGGARERIDVPDGLRLILVCAPTGSAQDVLPEVSKFLPVIEDMPPGKVVRFSSTNIMRGYVNGVFVEEKVLPTPDAVLEGALDRLDQEVVRLFKSTASFVQFMAHTADGQRGVAVARDNGVLSMIEVVPWKQRPERYAAVRRFFEERKLSVLQDYVAGEGKMRMMRFRLPKDEKAVARICRDALLELHGVGEDEPLLFTFEERP